MMEAFFALDMYGRSTIHFLCNVLLFRAEKRDPELAQTFVSTIN